MLQRKQRFVWILMGAVLASVMWLAVRLDDMAPQWVPAVEILDDNRSAAAGANIDGNEILKTGINLTAFRASGRARRVLAPEERRRLESADVWRPEAGYMASSWETGNKRVAHDEHHKSAPDYLKQMLVADYSPGVDKLYLMVKTGGSELWSKLPVHLYTTLTKVKHFGIYSDAPGSIAGYEVIDILQNVTGETLKRPEFDMYRAQRYLHDSNGQVDYSRINFNQAWHLDRYKNVPMLNHALQHAPDSVQWFMYIDADTYVLMDNVMNWLRGFDPQTPLQFGSPTAHADEVFAHGGSGVVMSRAALAKTLGEHQGLVEKYETHAYTTCCGDVLASRMLRETIGLGLHDEYPGAHISNFQSGDIATMLFRWQKWCNPIFTFHHVTPHEIERLWGYERVRRGQPIRMYDFYLDFVQPFIDDKVEHWDNGCDEVEFSLQGDRDNGKVDDDDEGDSDIDSKPYGSWQNCQKACHDVDECWAWRFSPEEKRCSMQKDSFKFGKPAHNWLKDSPSDITSGWMVDRIRQMRDSQHCDKLSSTLQDEGNKNGDKSDYVEGWARRRGEPVPPFHRE